VSSEYDATAELLAGVGSVSAERRRTTGGAGTLTTPETTAQTSAATAAVAGREFKLYQTHARWVRTLEMPVLLMMLLAEMDPHPALVRSAGPPVSRRDGYRLAAVGGSCGRSDRRTPPMGESRSRSTT